MKKKIIVIATLLAVAAILTAGSIAYFTAEETAVNVITAGGVDIELEEYMLNPDAAGETYLPFPEDGVFGVMPGATTSKIVQVRNTGSGAAFVRIHLAKNILLAAESTSIEPDLGLITLNLNTTDWLDGGDGFYYYHAPLLPDETTTPLFTEVAFATHMDNAYQLSTATIKVTAEAVQSQNNPGGTALAAVGWPVGP